ncbi:GNAT family N-acetyltransferase [Brevifollis gellanilyticus]|uniref:N-acetyltransferase domain-containing protein n=1 Tax=Brevifollis gellanilyticus TaxID=748831 RepID=A0A512M7F0_9BACT|nr:GNAT family N-acetyltransferase [Brevifollis gellanilyticus]GEP42656.1 hypothetical protein BGE01nite_19470 [Brevifollis gellanilyticus]
MTKAPAEVLRLRPVAAEDEAFLRKVYASTRATELAQVPWSAEQKAAFCDMQFTAQDTHYRANFTQAEYWVIERESVPAGRLYMERRDAEIHVIDIALLPEHQRSGFGTYLLKELMDEAAAEGKKVTIYVEKFNPALKLYQRLGYRHVEELGVYYLMEWLPAR